MHLRLSRTLAAALILAGPLAAQPSPWTPDTPEPGSVEQIRKFTTEARYLPETVAYVPESTSVPSPSDVLGHIAGAANELSNVATIYDYYRKLDAASDRVEMSVIGKTEEGRDLVLVRVSSAANLRNISRYKEITNLLADPRRTSEETMESLVAEGKPIYHLIGGLHSTETGSPEMLMELAYRLAVSEKPEIARIRDEVIVLITPVAEPDGRDRVVEWYYRHLRNRDLPYQELREFSSPPYWGHYAFHDNNRDGMQQALALTRAVHETFFEYRPHVVHDLHESLPLLYISTGHGPYSQAVSPLTINQWTQYAHNEAGALSAMGLPGVWTWGFWDGWWPGYLFSVANNHNSTGRFYETFGNSLAGTYERNLEDTRFVGRPVTEVQWYRPDPPAKKLVWSLRNNTNYMQAGVLEALSYTATHGEDLLRGGWTKASRNLEQAKTNAPYAWVFPEKQRDRGRLAYLINRLRAHRYEVHRLDRELKSGDKEYPAGSYVVRLDQPDRSAIITLLDVQKFPADEPNTPYDDVAWTWPLLYGVAGEKLADKKILESPMTLLSEDIAPRGSISGSGEIFLIADRGQNALLDLRLAIPGTIEAAETSFTAERKEYPAGTWIVQAPRESVQKAVGEIGIDAVAVRGMPEVRRHSVDMPRIGVMHTWTSTQDIGWIRYTFDQVRLPYTLIHDGDLRQGNLGARFDLILFGNSNGDLARLVHGLDPKYGPLAYTKTAEFPSHGVPDSSADITGGMGLEGLANLQKFVHDGGVLVTIENAGTLAVDGGIVRGISRVPQGSFNSPGSEVQAKVLRPEHPLVYGYEELPTVFRGNAPLFNVRGREQDRVVLQFGTKRVEAEDAVVNVAESHEWPAEDAASVKKEEEEKKKESKPLVLSGFVKGADVVEGKPAIIDVPTGKGRVILFNFNPLHRYLTHSDFRFVYNAILHWNDMP